MTARLIAPASIIIEQSPASRCTDGDYATLSFVNDGMVSCCPGKMGRQKPIDPISLKTLHKEENPLGAPYRQGHRRLRFFPVNFLCVGNLEASPGVEQISDCNSLLADIATLG
jgi:hypothetical protein